MLAQDTPSQIELKNFPASYQIVGSNTKRTYDIWKFHETLFNAHQVIEEIKMGPKAY